jgi:hypothetical protein
MYFEHWIQDILPELIQLSIFEHYRQQKVLRVFKKDHTPIIVRRSLEGLSRTSLTWRSRGSSNSSILSFERGLDDKATTGFREYHVYGGLFKKKLLL